MRMYRTAPADAGSKAQADELSVGRIIPPDNGWPTPWQWSRVDNPNCEKSAGAVRGADKSPFSKAAGDFSATVLIWSEP